MPEKSHKSASRPSAAAAVGVLPAGEDDYWSHARQPLQCLIFLTPLLLFYEWGVLWWGGTRADALRNGADHWMRTGLHRLGCDIAWLLPALVFCALFSWHLAGKYPWKVSTETLLGMFAESLLFAFGLVIIGQLQDLAFRHWGGTTACIASTSELTHLDGIAPAASLRTSTPTTALLSPSEVWPRIVSFIGAGVYEEVLFRLCLLPLCYGLFRLVGAPARGAVLGAVLLTSLGFSAAHYIGPAADHFALFSFTFRACAGLFFALLFVYRGFGITAGCHAAYDILVGVLWQWQQTST